MRFITLLYFICSSSFHNLKIQHKYLNTNNYSSIKTVKIFKQETSSELKKKEDISKLLQKTKLKVLSLINSKKYAEAKIKANYLIELASTKKNEHYLMFGYFYKAEISRIIYNWENPEIIKNYIKTKEIAEKISDIYMILSIDGRISTYYAYSGNYKESIKYKKNVVKKLEKIHPKEYHVTFKKSGLALSHYFNYITKDYLKIRKIDSAEYYNNKMHKYLEENESIDYWTKEYLINLGEINFFKKKYSLAEDYIKKAYKIKSPEYEKDIRFLQEKYKLGRIAFAQKDYKKTIDLLKEYTSKNLNELNALSDYPDYFWYLAKSYRKINDYENASIFFEKYISNSSSLEKIKDTFTINLRKNEILLFRKEIEKLETEKIHEKKNTYYLLLFFSVVLLTIFLFFKRKIYNNKKKFDQLIYKINNETTSTETTDLKKQNISYEVSKETINKIEIGLKKLESDKYFLNPNCSSFNVAKKIKINPKYISHVINIKYEKNFKTYINDLRINYVLVRLKNDSKFRLFSIESISRETGYKSAETFNRHFKKRTGIFPSYYIKQLKKLEN